MSPILDLQQALREVGRIRIGEKVATSNGKSRPAKLDRFRLTSRDRRAIDAAAELYGGTVGRWDAPDGPQWEVVTDADELPVIVPPEPMALSQWYETWSGGGCVRRCDGRTEYIGDQPCVCDPSNRECKATTRLAVMLPDVRGFGLWRIESHGWNAARELAGAVAMANRANDAGKLLPARLRLEQRQSKRVVDGKAQTMNYAVPVLDLDVSPAELAAPSTWQPVPKELPEGPAPPISEQLADLERPRPPRKNAAVPVKSADVEFDAPTDAQLLIKARRQATAAGVNPPTTIDEAKAFLAEADRPALPPVSDIRPATRRKLFALAGEYWPNESDDERRALVLALAAELGYAGLTSRTQITQSCADALIDALTEMVAIA